MAADGSVVFKVKANVSDAEKKLENLSRDIEKTEQEIASMTKEKEEAQQKSVFQAEELDAEKAKLQEIKAKLKEIKALSKDKGIGVDRREAYAAQIPRVQEELADQQTRVRMLQTEYNKTYNAVDRYTQKIEVATQKLDQQKTAAGILIQEINASSTASSRMGEAINQAGEYLDRFTKRLKGVFASAFIFNILSAGLRQFTSWMGKAIKTNSEAQAALAKLKGALLTLAQPLVNVLIPAFITLVNVLTKIAVVAANVMSKLFGTTVEQSAQAAENLNDEMNALEGVGKAAKDAGKSMASFDEINKIGAEDTSSSASGITPDFSGVGDLSWLSSTLGDMAEWVTAALLLGGVALVAIGAATGNIAMVLAGLLLLGSGLAVGEETGVFQNWVETLGLNSVEEFKTAALLLAGIAFIAIGAATANILMILAGIALLGAGITVGMESGTIANWAETLGLENVDSFISVALLLGGIALIAIGAAFGNILAVLAGLALLGAGIAVGIESGAIASWADALGLETVFDYVVAAIQLAGIVLIAIGAAMANIFMVIAGAVILTIGVAADVIGEQTLKDWWEVLSLTRVQQWVSVVMLLAGIALVAIGTAMANIFMVIAGIGLIGEGIVIAAQENNLKDWVSVLGLEKAVGWVTAGLMIGGIALIIFGIVTANMLMVLAGLGLLGAGIGIGITSGTFSTWLDAIIGAFAKFRDSILLIFSALGDGIKASVNWIIGLAEGLANGVVDGINTCIAALNNLSFDVPDWVPGIGGETWGFNIRPLSRVSIPRLAQGAVIPPNREFLAVLGDQRSGTNIEAPADLIRQMVAEGIRAAMGSGSSGRDIHITLELDRRVFAKAVYKANSEESQRVGVSFAGV